MALGVAEKRREQQHQTPLVFIYSFNYVFVECLFRARQVRNRGQQTSALMDRPDLLSVLANKVLFGT